MLAKAQNWLDPVHTSHIWVVWRSRGKATGILLLMAEVCG